MTPADFTRPGTAAVLGLGLVGGSLARELAGAGVRVLGFDRDPGVLAAAAASGAVQPIDALDRLREAEWVILAVPVDAAAPLLEEVREFVAGARLVTDAGSTKRGIVAAAERLGLGATFVGSHPLAGDHRSGWEASRPGLFRGACTYLTPTAATRPSALREAETLWRMCGAHTEVIGAAAHDERLAWSSHLPQAASSAIALTLRAAGITPAALGPGGRDLTRLAGSSPAVWTGIALENAAALEQALGALERELHGLRAALRAQDAAAVHDFFARGRAWGEDRG